MAGEENAVAGRLEQAGKSADGHTGQRLGEGLGRVSLEQIRGTTGTATGEAAKKMLDGFELNDGKPLDPQVQRKLQEMAKDPHFLANITAGTGAAIGASVAIALTIDAQSKKRDLSDQTGVRNLLTDEQRKLVAQAFGKIGTAIGEKVQKREDVPALQTSEFADRAKKLFVHLDTDGNGFLSGEELASAAQNSKYTGQDAQVIAALTRRRGDLEELSNDEWFDENDGITIKDLDKFAEMQKKYDQEIKPALNARSWLSNDENFKKLDRNNDGFIDKDDLNAAASNPNLTEDEKKMAAYLQRKRSDIEEASNDEWGDENDGITRKDIEKYVDKELPSTDEGEIVGKVAGTLFRTAQAQRAAVCTDLYATPNKPSDSIKPDAVKQGSIGDCYYMAALASVAATDPESIAKMIKDNKDGTYTVTFPGNKEEPITVTKPTAQEMGLYNGGTERGMWAAIMEKAYGKYCQQSVFRRSPMNLGGGYTPQDGADGGSATNSALRLLTGRGSDADFLSLTRESTIARKLEEAFSAKPPRAVTADIHGHLFSDSSADGFPDRHVYSVIGFEPDGKGGGTVIVRNPWGGADGTTSGTMRLSVHDFKKNFSNVNYSEAE